MPFLPLRMTLDALQALCPDVYPDWYERTYGPPSALYRDAPLNNCSVPGHAAAPAFGAFLQGYLRGKVLDLGCGPYAKPLYLADYPDALLSGLDPLPPFMPHPFEFAQGVAEFLPWPGDTFDVVITGTSLDHALVLDKVLSEIARVLVPGGRWVAWEHVGGHSERYDPYAGQFPGRDSCHLFKLGAWFVYDVAAHGLALERQQGEFYVFRRRNE